jgi:hypothetical protein
MADEYVALEVGDRVLVTISMRHEEQEGTIADVFNEYGDERVGIEFEDGTYEENSIYNVKYIGPDKYEYAVQFHYPDSEEPDAVSPRDWMSRENAERWLKTHSEGNKRREEMGYTQLTKGELVRRRKAGKVEKVEK